MTAASSPPVAEAVRAVRSGDVAALQRLLDDHPELVSARVPGPEGRTLLHVATDWPGHFPHVAETIRALVAAGLDVHARFVGEHTETALHWAASTDDVAAVAALLDAGADIDARGAVIGGGTALDDATAFGQWHAARLLVARGATVSDWAAAALGMTERLEPLLAGPPRDLDPLLWGACHGGHLGTVEALVAAGADPQWVGWDGLTPRGAAERSGATDVVRWLDREARGGS